MIVRGVSVVDVFVAFDAIFVPHTMSTALSIFNAGSTELRHVGLCLRRTLAARTNRRVSVHRELDCLFVRGCFARGAPNDCLAQMGHVSGPPETQVHGPVPLFAVRRNASALCDVLYAGIGIVGQPHPRVRVHVRSPLRVRGVRGGWLPDQEPFAVLPEWPIPRRGIVHDTSRRHIPPRKRACGTQRAWG